MAPKRFRSRLICVVIIGVLAFVPGTPAQAQQPTPSAADKQTARTLLIQGRKKLEAKDYAGALADFEAAHALVHAPTTGLDLARAQEALGRLVEARATAFAVANTPAQRFEPQAFTDARKEGARLVEQIESRIPSLLVRIEGTRAGPVEVTVDGEQIPQDALGHPRQLNPGSHEVVVSAPHHRTERRTVTLNAGETKPVEVPIVLQPDAPPPVRLPPAAPPPRADAKKNPVPVWSWVAGGAGIAALGAGVGFAVDHSAARKKIAADCPGDICDPNRYDLESMQALRRRWDRSLGLSIGLGAAGLAGVAVAVTGIVLRPDKETQVQSAIIPIISTDFQGIAWTGTF